MADGLDGLAADFAARVGPWLAALQARVPGAYIISGKRDSAEQWALRVQNCPDPAASPSMDCDPPTAMVGSSKHEQGRAVDIAPASAYNAAAALAPQFGLWAPVPGEPWHFEANPSVDPPSGGGGLLGGVANAASAIVPGAGPALAVVRWLGDPASWRRVGWVALGLVLLVIGVAVIRRRNIVDALDAATDAVPVVGAVKAAAS